MTSLTDEQIDALAAKYGDKYVDKRGRVSYEFDDYGVRNLLQAAGIQASPIPEPRTWDCFSPLLSCAAPGFCGEKKKCQYATPELGEDK